MSMQTPTTPSPVISPWGVAAQGLREEMLQEGNPPTEQQQAQEQQSEKVQAQVKPRAGQEYRLDDRLHAKQVPEAVETKNPSQQVPSQPQVPPGQDPQVHPQVNPASLRQAAFARGYLAPFVAHVQEYRRHYYSGAYGVGLPGSPMPFCMVHATMTPNCGFCQVEYWRHYTFFVDGYRHHGHVPPPPLPIFPRPVHQPSPSLDVFPRLLMITPLTCA
ncbi:hypothetical protein HDV57DRAFT_64531 [Trichoderma longibrachiatum]